MSGEFDYFGNPHVSKLVDLCLQLANDLHVAQQRVRALEMLLVRAGVLGEGDVDAFRPQGAEQGVLQEVGDAFLQRLVRVITEAGPSEHPLRDQWEEQLAALARNG